MKKLVKNEINLINGGISIQAGRGVNIRMNGDELFINGQRYYKPHANTINNLGKYIGIGAGVGFVAGAFLGKAISDSVPGAILPMALMGAAAVGAFTAIKCYEINHSIRIKGGTVIQW